MLRALVFVLPLAFPLTAQDVQSRPSRKRFDATAFPGATREAKISAAIAAASLSQGTQVYISDDLFPYDATLVTFSNAVPLVREGGAHNAGAWLDASAYGLTASLCCSNLVPRNDAALKAAVASVCAAAGATNPPAPGGLVPSVVLFVPSGNYLYSMLTLPCSSIALNGTGGAGGAPGTVLRRCCGGKAPGPLLSIGLPGATVTDVSVDDITFSGQGDSAGATSGIDIYCTRCHLNRVGVTYYNVAAFRFLGAASISGNGAGGFSDVTNCVVQNGYNNPSFAFVFVTQRGATGGPDANQITGCYVNTNWGWINDSTVAGATDIRASQSFVANRFEAAQSGTPLIAWKGQSDLDRVIANRWENTGTGGLAITLANAITVDPPATFIGNVWACGPGNCMWTDQATVKAIRIGESIGPLKHGQPYASSVTTLGGSLAVGQGATTWPANGNIPINLCSGNVFSIIATSNVADTVAIPTWIGQGCVAPVIHNTQPLWIIFLNNSGGTLTTGLAFKTGAGGFRASGSANPANGRRVAIEFVYDQVANLFIEVARTAISGGV